jgi:hypothetical protein
MRVARVLSLAVIFLFYASFARAQESKDVHNLQSGVFGVQGGASPTSYTFTTIDYPGAFSTWVYDISGNNILGGYEDAMSNTHGFLYSISNSTYTAINVPGAVVTRVSGISGDNILGIYDNGMDNTHGFRYDISKSIYTTIDAPGAFMTQPLGILGNNIVGSYEDAGFNDHLFLTTIAGTKPPLIKSLSPTSGTIGTEVTIKGKYFGSAQGSVSFNGISVTSYTSWSDTSIECIVPTDATTGPVVVTTAVGASNEKNFAVKPPQIKSLSPRSGTVETTVAIKGKYFGSARGSSTVSFNGTPVTNYTSWSDTTIKCTVPTGASTGPVVVTTTVGASNEKSFTVRP